MHTLTSSLGNCMILKALVCLLTLNSRTLIQRMPMATLKHTVTCTLKLEDVMAAFFRGSYPLDVRYGSVCNFLNLISLT